MENTNNNTNNDDDRTIDNNNTSEQKDINNENSNISQNSESINDQSVKQDTNSISDEEKYEIFKQRTYEVYNKYKDEEPDEWAKSYSFLASAIIFLIISVMFIILNNPGLLFMILILVINFLFTTYKILLFSNQRIYIYSTKLVYYYGLFNTKVKVFQYGSDDMSAIKSGIKSGILKKYLDYDNCYIINSRNLGFKLENINGPDEFLETITDKVYSFNKEIDPNYVMQERKIITSTGIYIDNSDIKK